jgi:ribosomal protein L14
MAVNFHLVVAAPRRSAWVTRDNAGVLAARSVHFVRVAGSFGHLLVSLTRVTPRFRRGDLLGVVTIGDRSGTVRRGGIRSALGYNGVIPTKKDGSPVGTRVYGPTLLEARHHGYLRLAMLSRGVV